MATPLRARYHLACLLALLSAGCAGLRHTVDYAPAARFSELETYEWAEAADGKEASDLDARVRAVFDRILRARGYVMVTANPDFLLHVHLGPRGIHFEESYRELRYRPSEGLPGGLDQRVYDSDALILDVIDRRGRVLIWRGATTRAFARDDPDRLFLRVELAAEVLLREFPPGPTGR